MRIAIAGLALAVVGYMLVQWLFVSETEKVENELHRLVGLAEQGGPDAAAEILALLADDYEGSHPYTRANIERMVEAIVTPGTIESIQVGDFKVIAKGDGIVVPIFRVTAVPHGTVIVTLFFGDRGGEWKLTNVTRWKMAR
jgi:hypothetical protein